MDQADLKLQRSTWLSLRSARVKTCATKPSLTHRFYEVEKPGRGGGGGDTNTLYLRVPYCTLAGLTQGLCAHQLPTPLSQQL